MRAIAQAGLLDPLGDYYQYTSIQANGESWVVSFVANHCYRTEVQETCDPDQGRSNHVTPDAWLEIAVSGTDFIVTDTFGRFSDEDAAELMAYSEPSTVEVGHVEYPTVRYDEHPQGDVYSVKAAGLWAGDLSERVWSICEAVLLDASGNEIERLDSLIADYSRGERFRSGWFLGMGTREVAGAVDAVMDCFVFEGETWRVKGEPKITRRSNRRVDIVAKLDWTLGYLIAGLKSRCDVTLFDSDGEVLKEFSRVGPYSPWTRSRLRNQFLYADTRVERSRTLDRVDIFCHEARGERP